MKTEAKTRLLKVLVAAMLLLLVSAILVSFKFRSCVDYEKYGSIILSAIGIVLTGLYSCLGSVETEGVVMGPEKGTVFDFEGRRISVDQIEELQKAERKWWKRVFVVGQLFVITGALLQIFK